LIVDPDLMQFNPHIFMKEWLLKEKEFHYYCRKVLLNFLKIAKMSH